MKIIKAKHLACPIDGKPLEAREKQLVCESGHAFDVARQGYVNLLPVQHKRSKFPGDSKDMVAARTRFLNSGIYEPVANKLAEIVDTHISGDTGRCLLDAGCGEGYYLNRLLNHLKGIDGKGELSFIGLDISKPAIVEATRRNRQITWVVGTNRQPPVACASVDIIICVFGFQSFEGFSGIVKPGGKVILVEPGPDHLREMREVIYTDVKQSEPQAFPDDTTGFQVVDTQTLQFETDAINAEQIQDLLLMTPHFYRASQEGRAAAEQLKELKLTVDMVFRTLEYRNREGV